MAKPRRKSARHNAAAGTPEPAEEGALVSSQQTEEGDDASNKQETDRADDDKCPACSPDIPPVETESWVRCDACKTWFHWRCAGKGELEAIDKWYCRPCLDEDTKRVITMKPPARKSSRKRTTRDYAGLNSGQESDPLRWTRILERKDIKPHPFPRMKGHELTVDWLEHDVSAFQEPILIETPEGLGMKMPDPNFSPQNVAGILGDDTPLEVIDVATQSNAPGWTLRKWADYCAQDPSARDRIRNVISLEVSGTELADKILPPRLVREVDWVDRFWPSTKKGRGHSYPKVQLYCLMGVTNAWTDWHIDFAGSSVYYHIINGSKVFYFIRPTPANLAAYERWSGTEMQNHSWLGDMCDEVYKIELTQGNTLIIPTGWIHAVYTPMDTMVFGGNFLHSYNFSTQLRVREIEIATHVPKRFRYPFFSKLCWYAAEKYLRDLKAKEEFPPRVMDSIEALADFLVNEARTTEKGTEQAKKEAKEAVPGDRVKDAPALARELRWRVRLAAGYASDDDVASRKKRKAPATTNGDTTSAAGNKKKRVAEESEDLLAQPFRNFKPKTWDKMADKPVETEERTVKMRRVDGSDEGWKDRWTDGKTDAEEDGEEATLKVRKNVLVKVRRTANGLERHRVERITEEWVWPAVDAGEEVKPRLENSPPTVSESSEPVAPPENQPSGEHSPDAMAVDTEPPVNGQPQPSETAPIDEANSSNT